MQVCPNCGSSETVNIESGKYYCSSCRETFVPYVKKIIPAIQKSNTSGAGTKIFNTNINKTLLITGASSGGVSNGTGLIISSGGYIVTNAHVVLNSGDDGALPYDLLIAKYNGEEAVNKLLLIDYDEELDLSILKLSAAPEAISRISLSSKTQAVIGEEVYVLGNAKAMGISITKGIVSSACHKVSENEFIMIDNAINSGNSGGPAFNSVGQCLGLVSSSLAGAVGMSFIIPSKTVLEYINSVSKGYNLNIL